MPLQEPEEAAVHDLREKLATPVTLDGFEPNTPFKEVVGFISERYGVNFTYDLPALREALKAGKNEDPAEVVGNKVVAMSKVVNVPLGEVLEILVSQVDDEHAIRYRATREGVQITSAAPKRAFRGRRLPGEKENTIAPEPGLPATPPASASFEELTHPMEHRRLRGEHAAAKQRPCSWVSATGIFWINPHHFAPFRPRAGKHFGQPETGARHSHGGRAVGAAGKPGREGRTAAREPQAMTAKESSSVPPKRREADDNARGCLAVSYPRIVHRSDSRSGPG